MRWLENFLGTFFHMILTFFLQPPFHYQPSFAPSAPDRTADLASNTYDSHERLSPNTLDSRELQEKANEQLHSIKLQQMLLQNRAKQWIQQQQAQQQVCLQTYKWATSSEKVPLNIHRMRRFRSSCICAKYHTGLCSHSYIL